VLVYCMSISIDGFVADRDGDFGWTTPPDEVFDLHLELNRGVGVFLLGRRLYETMLGWETDPAMRDTPAHTAFADVWSAIPKVVFSRTLERVQGNARLAGRPLVEEVDAAREATDLDVSIGGPDLAAQAFELGLVDELRIVRYPMVLGAGKPYLPPVAEHVAFDLAEVRTFGGRAVFERYRLGSSPGRG